MATASSAPLRTDHWSSRATEARGFQPLDTLFSVDSASSSSTAAVVLVPDSSFTPPSEEFLDASSDRYPSEVVGFSSSSSPTVVMSSLDDSIGETRHNSLENNGASSNADKKQAWGKPLNDSSEVGAPVMGAIWPSLGQSIASLNSSSSSDSLKSLTDGSLFPLKGPGPASSSQRQVANDTANPSSSNNHVLPKRQRSVKRGGGSTSNSNVSDNGLSFQPQQPPQGLVMEAESNNSGKIANAPAESSSSNHMPEVGGQMGHFGSHSHSGNEQQRGHFGPQSHNGNNHQQQQRNTFRRVNVGPHSRGDGSYHQSHVGSRQHDRGNHHKWNPNRSFGSRDSRMQPHRFVPRGFIQPPTHGASVFRPPPFGNPIHYHDAASSLFYVPAPPIDSMRGVPMVMPIPPSVYFPASQLHAKIVKQIDYYFSNENLIKDIYLRRKMDNEGWVSIELIAGFKKVMELTNSIRLIVDALQMSSIVEVQGNKIRKRNDWARWVMPPSNQYSAVPSPQSHGRSGPVMLATQLERVSLDANTGNSNFEGCVRSSSSGELNHQAHSTTQTTIYPGDEV